eukprot:scaffold178391_cov21-Tisochrysis_lutea.AAC.2
MQGLTQKYVSMATATSGAGLVKQHQCSFCSQLQVLCSSRTPTCSTRQAATLPSPAALDCRPQAWQSWTSATTASWATMHWVLVHASLGVPSRAP